MATQLLHAVHFAGLGLYSSVVIVFAGYTAFCRLSKSRNNLVALRRYRWFGAILGLSMGAIFFGGLGLHYLQAGGFVFTESMNSSQLPLKYGIFALLWLSSFHLEIWTLQGVRNLDPNSELQVTEITPAYTAAAGRVSNQLLVNTGLLVAIAYLSTVG